METLTRLILNPWFRILLYAARGMWSVVLGPVLILLALGALGLPVAVTVKTVAAVWFLKAYAFRLFTPTVTVVEGQP